LLALATPAAAAPTARGIDADTGLLAFATPTARGIDADAGLLAFATPTARGVNAEAGRLAFDAVTTARRVNADPGFLASTRIRDQRDSRVQIITRIDERMAITACHVDLLVGSGNGGVERMSPSESAAGNQRISTGTS
jgi:hypothetical protein